MSRTEVVIKTDSLSGLAVSEPALLALLRDDVFPQAWNARQIIKQEGDRCVAVVRAENAASYLLKCRQSTLMKRLSACVIKPLARAHDNVNFLVQHQVPVARSLGFFRWREAGQPEQWFQIQEYISNAVTLEQALTELYASDAALQQALIHEAARQLGRIHQLGRYHGDMKLSNILVHAQQVILIDIQGGRSPRLQRWQQKDLGRFLVGLKEANVQPVQIEEAIKVYQQQSDNRSERFMSAVNRFVEKITERHRLRYGSPQ